MNIVRFPVVSRNYTGDTQPPFNLVHSACREYRERLLHTIGGKWMETWYADPYLLYQNNESGVIIFATDDDLKELARCSTFYIDGKEETPSKKTDKNP